MNGKRKIETLMLKTLKIIENRQLRQQIPKFTY